MPLTPSLILNKASWIDASEQEIDAFYVLCMSSNIPLSLLTLSSYRLFRVRHDDVPLRLTPSQVSTLLSDIFIASKPQD